MSETIITGIIDIGREDIDGPFARPFPFYLESLLTIMAYCHPELISRRMILRDRLSFLGPLYARFRKVCGH
jgi:hypothetical protein